MPPFEEGYCGTGQDGYVGYLGYPFYKKVVIVRNIWQKLSSVEREKTLIVTHFWQLFSRIFGETSLIVTNIWRNLAYSPHFYHFACCSTKAFKIEK